MLRSKKYKLRYSEATECWKQWSVISLENLLLSPQILSCLSSRAKYHWRQFGSNTFTTNLVTFGWIYFLVQLKNICTCQQLLYTHTQIASTDLLITGGFWSFSLPSWQCFLRVNSFDPQQLCQGRGGLNCQDVERYFWGHIHSLYVQQHRAPEKKPLHLEKSHLSPWHLSLGDWTKVLTDSSNCKL